jgi:hypothetical protein
LTLKFSASCHDLLSSLNFPSITATLVKELKSLIALLTMDTKTDLPLKKGSVHQDEFPQKHIDNPMFKGVSVEKQQIYLSYAAKDDEWKTFHTKQLLRKVDLRLLPLLILMYLLNFLDRSNLAQARLGTLEEDLGMKGTDFNLATSILFVVSRLWKQFYKSFLRRSFLLRNRKLFIRMS